MSKELRVNADSLYKHIKEQMSEEVNPGLGRIAAGYEDDSYLQDDAFSLGQNIVAAFEAEHLESQVEIPEHMVTMSKNAVMASLDPVGSIKNVLGKDLTSDFKGKAGFEDDTFVSVGQTAYGDNSDVLAGFEAFDGATVEPQVHYNVMYGALASVQDPAAELFFPVIPVGANTSAASMSLRITNVMTDFKRGVTGAPAASSFNKKSLVKILNNEDEINVDKNRLVPVSKADNVPFLVAGVSATEVTYNGETVDTKPVKIDTDVNLISLGQSEAMIASGALDTTDALDPNVKINDIYFTLSGKDESDADVTENFAFDISILNTAFTYSTTEDSLDIALNAKLGALSLNTTTTNAVGSDTSTLLRALPSGYSVVVAMKLVGDGNVQTGDINVGARGITLVKVVNAAGDTIATTDADYVEIKAVIDTLTVTGYVPEAYITNSNTRVNGLQLTSNKVTALFNVPFRTGDTIFLPVVKNGDNSDAEYLGALNAQIGTGIWKLNLAAFRTIANFMSFMEQSADDVEIGGLSKLLVNKAFIREPLDLTAAVDSRESTSRSESISAAIALKVKQAAVKLYLDSNYGVAASTYQAGVKPTVIVMTDTIIGTYLREEDFTNGMFNFKIASTINENIKGKVIFSFGVFDGNRNKEPNPLNFGQCFKGADVNISIPKTVHNGARIVNTTIHRFQHYVNLPILGVFDISNIDTVIGKLAVNMKTVA